MSAVYETVKTPYKYGLLLCPEKGEMLDNPCVYRHGDAWYMLYIRFDKRGYETHLAQSDDLVNWRKLGCVLSRGEPGTWDSAQADGWPVLLDGRWNGPNTLGTHDGRYWMMYIGGHADGYETDPLSTGVAWTDDPAKARPWTRIAGNPVLRPSDPDARDFERKTIFKHYVVDDPARSLGGRYVTYYNAKQEGVWRETIGMAVSDDLRRWRRYGKDPVLDGGKPGKFAITGDPMIRKIGELYVMFHFGVGWGPGEKHAFDTFACSRDLVHWKPWQGVPLVAPSEPWDRAHAHKPWVICHDGVVYHFYCAVGEQGRAIALATSKDLRADFQRPKTTRRYLQGPLSERLAVYFREGKITLGENIHSDDWDSVRYWKDVQPAHGVWLVHGSDDTAFDLQKAELSRDPDGIPVHSQTWREGGLEVVLSACSPFGPRSSVQGRLTVTNRSKTTRTERLGLIVRSGAERKLVWGSPDHYVIYAPDVAEWKKHPSTFAVGADGRLLENDHFVTFGIAPEWDAKSGVARFAVQLDPGEKRTIEFALGKGIPERPDFASAEASVRAAWAKELARIVDRTPFVRSLAVQILQCFARPTVGDFVLPRQGGLQRFSWPGESVHVLEALDRLGYHEYVVQALDFFFRFAKPNGQIGPFANGWAGDTAYVLEMLARHCLVTDDRATWDRHRAAALRAFGWIAATRAETAAGGEGIVAGLFPPLKSTDSKKCFQHWGMTDLVNEHALKVLGDAATHFGELSAGKIQDEWRAYRGVIEQVLARWRQASSGKDTFFIPLAPAGANEAQFRADNFFYLHPGAFVEGEYLTKDEMMRLRTWLIREGIASEKGLYQRHPSDKPELGTRLWYTTWSEYQWSVGWRRVGRPDLARLSLDALRKWSVTDEDYVGERISEVSPWYFPWSPNASGAARILKMLLDEGLDRLCCAK